MDDLKTIAEEFAIPMHGCECHVCAPLIRLLEEILRLRREVSQLQADNRRLETDW